MFLVFSVIQMFTGIHYGGSYERDAVYSFYGGMQIVDCLYGLLLIVTLVWAIRARFALAGFKANGPSMLMVMCALNLAGGIIYPLAASIVTDLAFFEMVDIPSLVGSAAFMAINKVYYDKRMHMFVN